MNTFHPSHPALPQALERLLTDREVAALTGLSQASIRRRRRLRRAPAFMKIGGAVRYRPEDVRAWLAAEAEEGAPR